MERDRGNVHAWKRLQLGAFTTQTAYDKSVTLVFESHVYGQNVVMNFNTPMEAQEWSGTLAYAIGKVRALEHTTPIIPLKGKPDKTEWIWLHEGSLYWFKKAMVLLVYCLHADQFSSPLLGQLTRWQNLQKRRWN
jgi:hypothetical protein